MTTRDNLSEMINSSQALILLKEGNRRYVLGESQGLIATPEMRSHLIEYGQVPFAIILGCSDSRVPPEIIFDVGIGQIFVVRTAGNTVDSLAIGSVEFAAEYFHVPLVVVLGHQYCGAVLATVSGEDYAHNIRTVIDAVQFSENTLYGEGKEHDLRLYENENIRNTVSMLDGSSILKKHVLNGSLKIIGAKYELDTGEVHFWE